jgi:multicomponent Na+:H+ antiporter subunit D
MVAAALAVSLLTMFSMIKIWTEVFWKKDPKGESAGVAAAALPARNATLLLAPIVVIALLIVGIGVAAELVFPLALEAARQLMDPEEYVQAVLGAQP